MFKTKTMNDVGNAEFMVDELGELFWVDRAARCWWVKMPDDSWMAESMQPSMDDHTLPTIYGLAVDSMMARKDSAYGWTSKITSEVRVVREWAVGQLNIERLRALVGLVSVLRPMRPPPETLLDYLTGQGHGDSTEQVVGEEGSEHHQPSRGGKADGSGEAKGTTESD